MIKKIMLSLILLVLLSVVFCEEEISINYTGSFEKLDVYPIDDNYYILNKHTQKNWWSTVSLKSIKSPAFEIKIQSTAAYVYDVNIINTDDLDNCLILVFDSTHMGNGGCWVYNFNKKMSKLNLITCVDNTKISGFFFSIDRLWPSYEDYNHDGIKELIFTGWKSNGYGKYAYKKIILFKKDLVFDKVIEEYSLDEKFEALLCYFALGDDFLGTAKAELIDICKNNEKVNYKKIYEYDGVKYDVLRLLLSRYSNNVVCDKVEVINKIIQNKETHLYRYLFLLLESEKNSKKSNDVEKIFFERYRLYTTGVIENLSDI